MRRCGGSSGLGKALKTLDEPGEIIRMEDRKGFEYEALACHPLWLCLLLTVVCGGVHGISSAPPTGTGTIGASPPLPQPQ